MALALLTLIVSSTSVYAQKFDNQTNGRITNNGNIKFRSENGQLLNEDATPVSGGLINNSSGTITFLGNNSGTITNWFAGTNPIGEDATERINGWVVYAATAGQQDLFDIGAGVQYYTNMMVDGASTKDIYDGVHVSGTYLNNALTSGSRSYTGTFYYDGDVAQIIAPEDNDVSDENNYRNLDFSGTGAKNINMDSYGTDGKVTVLENLTVAADPDVNVYDDLLIGKDGGAGSTVAGDVYIGQAGQVGTFEMRNGDYDYNGIIDINNGEFRVAGSGSGNYFGDVTVNSGTFSLYSTNTGGNAVFDAAVTLDVQSGGGVALADNVTGYIDVDGNIQLADAADAQLELGQNTKMFVGNVFTNAYAARTNMSFASGSEFIYDAAGAQNVVSTVVSNPYANLYIEGGGTKTLPTGTGAINVNENFGIGTHPDVAAAVGTLTFEEINGDDVGLFMTNGSASYTDADAANASEVVGKFRRINSPTAALNATTDYVFNNNLTQINFLDLPQNDGYVQLDVRPGTAASPAYIDGPTAPTADVQRLIVVSYDDASIGAASPTSLDQIRMGYLDAEYTSAGNPENEMRFLEGTGQNGGLTDRMEKINMHYQSGQTWTNNGGAGNPAWNYLELNEGGGPGPGDPLVAVAGVDSRNSYQDVGKGSAIVLTDEENFLITIAKGRWSDDDTWDEGRPPRSDERCIVRHLVYTGMDGGEFDSDVETRDEADVPGVTDIGTNEFLLCRRVEIKDPATYPGAGDHGAIVIANSDVDGSNDPNGTFVFGNTGINSGLYMENLSLGSPANWDGDNTSTGNWEATEGGELQGIYVTADGYDGATGTTTMRTSRYVNQGSLVNDGTIEIGQ